MKYLLLILCYFSFNRLIGQEIRMEDFISFNVDIIDAETHSAIPYASVYNVNANRGTYSNMEGQAALYYNHAGDSIYISSIGYEKVLIVLQKDIHNDIIELTPMTHELAALTIHASDTFLYELLEKSRKHRNSKSLMAASYFNLQTFEKTNQIELIECYYNGKYSDYAVQELQLKQGRIALKPFAGRSFISTEISKSICLHNAFETSDYFPHSPLEFSLKQNRKKFKLLDGGRLSIDKNTIIQIVRFEPKNENGQYFSGEIWLDEKTADIIKITLNLEDAKTYPFAPIGHSDRLKKVNIHLTKSYTRHNGIMTLEKVNFNYDLHYLTSDMQEFTLSTLALLVAFDYEELFTLPMFQYSPAAYEDYVKINATPYNAKFWSNYKRFEMEEIKQKNEVFLANDSTITNQHRFFNDSTLKNNLLERPYFIWNDSTSIRFREVLDDSVNYNKYQLKAPAERYHLEVQLYMDVNDYEGNLECTTATIFDPYQSYFYFPITEVSNQFFTLYFKLGEQFRKRLQQMNLSAKSVEDMYANYTLVEASFQKTSKLFFKEVERGNNSSGMKKWTDKIENGDF